MLGLARSRPTIEHMAPNQASLSAQIHAAFEWWADAGVDLDFDDDATDWLVTEEPAKAAKAVTKS